MPTIYTALRARNRHKLVPPEPSLPKAELFAAPVDKTFLEVEKDSTTAHLAYRAEESGLPGLTKPTRKIVVIGAGLAGLCAAYELDGLGYDVTVYEARDRFGGRVQSIGNFVDGKIAEGGAELIGSNHPLWNSYKHHFNLSFSDVLEYGNSPFVLKGTTLTAEQSKDLTDEMEKQFKLLTNLAESIIDPFEPWTNRNAKALDNISIGEWISRAKCSPLCRHAISVMLAADNGIPTNQQSLLAILAMVKGGGLDRYWTDTELFRCRGGNQTLAERFASQLNQKDGTVCKNSPVESISPSGTRVSLKVKGIEAPVEADDVILAVPPSVWYTINVERFPELAARLSKSPKMGSNVKYLMRFEKRFWKEFASSPTLSEDGPVDLTWETTEEFKDNDGDFVMVAFSGSIDAEECAAWADDERKAKYIGAMQNPYPGIGQQIRKTEFMNWPSQDWTKASYYFPRRNEVTEWGPFWRAGYGGWLHFAGEHTSYAFMGYMEGALSSGYRLARRLAVRDKLLPA
jgi:monoamine oxidase